MKFSEISTVICLLLGAKQVQSGGHDIEIETLRDLELECESGWEIYKGNCYKYESFPLNLEEAHRACWRQGSNLYYQENDVEYGQFVGKHWPGKIWVDLEGDGYTEMPEWENSSDFQNALRRPIGEGYSVSAKETPGHPTPFNANMSLPFVCKRRSCLKGYTSCDLNNKCIQDEKVCDGKPDCLDLSDENECSENYLRPGVNESGQISIRSFNGLTEKRWTIEAPLGKRIKLTIPAYNFDNDDAKVSVYSGSPSLHMATQLYMSTFGANKLKTIYSVNNYIVVRYLARDMTKSRSLSIQWTTGIPEIKDTPVVREASNSELSLTIPFSDEEFKPADLVLDWIIKAGDGKYISYYLDITALDKSVPLSEDEKYDVEFEVYVDDMPVSYGHYYLSNTNIIKIRSMFIPDGGKVVLRYSTDCDVTISIPFGYVHSPSPIPNSISCTWNFTGSQNAGGRGMTIYFEDLNPAVDVRTDPTAVSEDTFEINLNNGDAPNTTVNEGDIFHSPSGQVSVKFTSDVSLQAGHFLFRFATDCASLDLSDETMLSTTDAFFDERATLTCPLGYSFDMEKYRDNSEVNITCRHDGWYVLMEQESKCIPECQIVYCGTPEKIENGGVVSIDGVTFNSTAKYECNPGFDMDGFNGTVTCNEHGNWVNTPTCTSSSCEALAADIVENGGFEIIAGNNFTNLNAEFNTVVQFSCDDGFELLGPVITHCTKDGWTHDNPPICQRLKCPDVEYLPHATIVGGTENEFESTVYVECDEGYIDHVINDTQITILCQANQIYDYMPSCEDIDECDADECETGTACVNTDGSYSCDCRDGYERATPLSCTDINECDDGNGGCGEVCTNDEPFYTCSCNTPGNVLYIENGYQGFTLHGSETGTTPGDTYRVNHTCVPLLCPALNSVENGAYLAKDVVNFHVGDSVRFRCDDGYVIDGTETITEENVMCNTTGDWDQLYSCVARECEPNVTLGEIVEKTCTLAYGRTVTYSAICIYEGGAMIYAGENIAACPEIDCGDPENSPVWPEGGIFDGDAPASTYYSGDSTFEFTCAPGYEPVGLSGNLSYTVSCTADGHWDMGNLTCNGKRCKDPGTPAGAIQVADRYEVDSVLYYTCNRPGFTITGPDNYTCDYDEVTGNVSWSGDLDNTLPECIDTELPSIPSVNCDGSLRFYPMDLVDLRLQEPTDNFAVKSWTTENQINGAIYITEAFNLTQIVEDHYNNTAPLCIIEYTVIDPAVKPDLVCHPFVELYVDNSTTVYSEDVESMINDYTGQLELSSTAINYNIVNIGDAYTVDATATNTDGIESYCTFIVTVSAGICFDSEIFVDVNADRSCDTDGVGVLTCLSTCKTGYLYSNGMTSQNFTCSGTRESISWDPADYCLDVQYPINEVHVDLTHTYGTFTFNCAQDYRTAVTSSLATFESNIRSVCDGMNWDVTVVTTNRGGSVRELVATLNLELLTFDNSQYSPVECLARVGNISLGVFELPNKQLLCDGTTDSIDVAEVTIGTPTLTCADPAYYQITRTSDSEIVCVSTDPGNYFDGVQITQCEEGSYQDHLGQSSCKPCPDGTYPNADKTGCQDTCPPGFRSDDGFYPCSPCGTDMYWVDKTTCSNCLPNWSTVGHDAVSSIDGCFAPCEQGYYSRSGYNNTGCVVCPSNFYQDVIGQTQCTRCPVDKEYQLVGATHSDNCTDITGCNRTNTCSGNGNCSFVFNTKRCTCDDGYYGEDCSQQFHVCDGYPCQNDGTCVPGETPFEYTCECDTVFDECVMQRMNATHGGVQTSANVLRPVPNNDACFNLCLEDYVDWCVAVSVYPDPSPDPDGNQLACFLYNVTLSLDEIIEDSGMYYEKTCFIGFTGDNCEVDNKNECDTEQCNPDAECKDKVGGFECICPSSGGYSGPLCASDTDPCSPNPCQNNGKCTSNGKNFYCECAAGYIGSYCENDEDYCSLHPLICGNRGDCIDHPPSRNTPYRCYCHDSFSGGNCEVSPDFCDDHQCYGENYCYSSNNERDGACVCDSDYFAPVYKYNMTIELFERSPTPNDNVISADDSIQTVKDCQDLCQYNTDCVAAVFFEDPDIACYMYNQTWESGTADNTTITILKDLTTPSPEPYSCERVAFPCDSVTCENNGTCIDSSNGLSYQCSCEAGYTGQNCQHAIDDCMSNPCKNGGVCSDQHLGFSCTCTAGFDGDTCEFDIDFCPGNCSTVNGTCIKMDNGYRCACNSGFIGEFCEIELNECNSYPCEHNGTCTDAINGYSCECMAGWEGVNCQDRIDRCDTITCYNGGDCFNLLDAPFCRCQGGVLGEFCDNATLMCDIMSGFSPCINEGECVDTAGSAVCECPITHNGERCFFNATEGYSGGRDAYDHKVGFGITQKTCLDTCMDDPECFSMSHVVDGDGEVLCSFYEEDKAVMNEETDVSVHFTKICPIDYVGDSCELVKDWCADNPCENDGTCMCKEPFGYKCMCQPGYSGVNCQNVYDFCKSNPCSGDVRATCYSTPTYYECRCRDGGTWTGNSCKDMADDFVLFVNGYHFNTAARTSGYMIGESGELSVSMKFRLHEDEGVASYLLLLKGYPTFEDYYTDTYRFQLAIKPDMVLFLRTDIYTTFVNFTDDFSYINVADGEWHHIGVSINNDGYMSVSVDAVSMEDPVLLEQWSSISNFHVRHFLGKMVIAEFRDVMVWDKALDDREFVLASDDTFPSLPPIKRWMDLDLPYYVTVLNDELPYVITLHDDLFSNLDCGAVSDIEFVSTERITPLANVTSFANVLNTLMNDDNPWTFAHSVPEALTNDYYPVIITAKDGEGRYKQCRSNLYIKYNVECPALDTHNMMSSTCPDTDQDYCDFSCDNGQVVSASLPNSISCGSLGVWKYNEPYSTLPLPSCVEPSPAEYNIKLTMEYEVPIACENIFSASVKENLKIRVLGQFKDVSWVKMCSDDVCSNLEISVECLTSIVNRFELYLSFTVSSLEITLVNGNNMSITEAFEIMFLLEGDIDLSDVGGSTFLTDTFVIETEYVCPVGNALIDEQCAPCSAGWFLDEATLKCKPCPYGEYQTDLGTTACIPCDDGYITYIMGAQSSEDCKVKCPAGSSYDMDTEACEVCPRHYYQPEEGRNFCYPCEIGYKTVLNGSDSVNDCKADCKPGYERNATTEVCEVCQQGYWRSLNFDDCKKCEEGKTTFKDVIAETPDACSMDICDLGQFFNVDIGQCEDCAFGFYQDEMYQLTCKQCSGNRTTELMGSTNITDCRFYCPVGYYVGDVEETCSPCERGSFKDNTDLFGECVQCVDSTTNGMASTHVANCSLPVCEQGQYIEGSDCRDCAIDSYSDQELPYLSTTCILCEDRYGSNYGTQQTRSNSSQCERYCDPGLYLMDGKCTVCPRGSYKDEAGRFGGCVSCGVDSTTENEGSSDSNDCSIPRCAAGNVIKDGTCSLCPIDSFSEVDEPNSDVECMTCYDATCDECMAYGTEFEGTDNSSLCLPSCPAGTYYNADSHSCEYCLMGTYKTENDRFSTLCEDCPTGFVTEDDGAISVDECTLRDCPAGSKIIGTTVDDFDCEQCEEGTFQNQSRQNFCYQCGPNRNTNGPGKTSSSDCQISCGPGLHGTEVCVPCEDGFNKSTEGYADCEQCPEDTTSNADHTLCDVVYCHYGKEYDAVSDSCVECVTGYFKNELGNSQQCMACDEGTTTDGTGQANCTEPFCVPGQYLMNGECVPCLTGTYKGSPGNEACTQCDADYTTAGEGSTSDGDCNIVVCAAGQYRNPNQTSVCSVCRLNTYQPDRGTTSCEECPGGTITMSEGETSPDDCVPECDAGEFYNETSRTCKLCPTGTYKPNVGNTEECTGCPVDKTTIGRGKITIDDCSQDLCRPGTFYNVKVDSVSCDVCPRGTYSDQSNMMSCTPCNTGFTTRYDGTTTETECIEDCEEGYGYSTVNNECVICPTGQFNDQQGLNPTVCKRCPKGTTNSKSGETSCDFVDTTPVIENDVDVSISLDFSIQIDSCTDTNAININLGPINGLINALFVNMMASRFNGDLSFCSENCNNIIVTYNDVCSVIQGSSHQITLDVVFRQIREFVTDTTDNNLELSTLEVIAEILSLQSSALIDAARDIAFVRFTGATYIDVCQPGEQQVGDSCEPCEPGYYGEDSLTCIACPQNTTQSLAGQTSCDACPDNTYTESTNTTSQQDCIEICAAGYFLDTLCTVCPVGFYKTTPGNVDSCVACPTGKTTTITGATSADACSENVCQVGQYFVRDNNNIVQCIDCAKGTYSDVPMVTECTSCGAGRTTALTGSTSDTNCFNDCPIGQGVTFPAKTCDRCPVNFFNNKQGNNPEMCKACPNGTYTSSPGMASCSPDLTGVPTPIQVVTVTIQVTYDVALDGCTNTASLSKIKTHISFKIRASLWNRSQQRFSQGRSYCTEECINISVDFIQNTNNAKRCQAKSSTRRKRALTHEITLEVTASNVPETVSDGTDAILTKEALSQVIATDDITVDENIVYQSAAAPVVVPVCGEGQQLIGVNCEACPVGYYSDDTGSCKGCPADTYQNETGQTSCKQCPPMTFSNNIASTGINNCVGFCSNNPNWCNSRGTCTETGRRTADCSCNDGFEGERCETISEPQSSLDVILGVAIGGGGGLLIIILIIIGCWRYYADQDSKKKKQMHDPEYFTNGMYDNAGFYPVAPHRSIGYPVIGHNPNASFEGSHIDPYRHERPSIHGDDKDDGPTYIWTA